MKLSLSIKLIGIIPFVVFCSIGVARTHCATDEGEFVQFSCQIAGSGKVASLCGGYAISDDPKTEWLQYRFGKIGNVEFTYPREKTGSLMKFQGDFFGKYDYLSYLFINDKALYEIELSEYVKKGKVGVAGVINVEVGKTRHKLLCSKPVGSDDWDSLKELSSRTFHYTGDGKNSFSYQYYNYIAK